MSKTFRLAIVTPEKPVLEKDVEFVALPAWEGEMGVLAGHAACAVQLTEGMLRYKSGSEIGEFAVMGGFAEVLDNVVSVFAEAAELASEINEESERQALEKARKAIASKSPDMDLKTAEAAIRMSLARMRLLQHQKKKT